MKSIASSLGRAILGTILCLLTMASPGWGGGSDDEAPDAHQDNGPSYFAALGRKPIRRPWFVMCAHRARRSHLSAIPRNGVR